MGLSCHGLFHKVGRGSAHEISSIKRCDELFKEHIIHRFGIPQTITTDGGSVFISEEFRKFVDDMGIKLIRSSPYYAQANGQAEASNQSLIKLIKRKIDEYPRCWHEVLSEALWAYRISYHGSTKTSPYHLVYGQDTVLPWVRQVSYCCQWPTPREVFPEHVGERVTRANETHLAIL